MKKDIWYNDCTMSQDDKQNAQEEKPRFIVREEFNLKIVREKIKEF